MCLDNLAGCALIRVNNYSCPFLYIRYFCDYCDTHLTHDSVGCPRVMFLTSPPPSVCPFSICSPSVYLFSFLFLPATIPSHLFPLLPALPLLLFPHFLALLPLPTFFLLPLSRLCVRPITLVASTRRQSSSIT